MLTEDLLQYAGLQGLYKMTERSPGELESQRWAEDAQQQHKEKHDRRAESDRADRDFTVVSRPPAGEPVSARRSRSRPSVGVTDSGLSQSAARIWSQPVSVRHDQRRYKYQRRQSSRDPDVQRNAGVPDG